MSQHGRYADGRSYTLPDSWTPVSAALLETTLAKALTALAGDSSTQRLSYFYNPSGEYAGTSFLDAGRNSESSIEADDLYAVSRLSITVSNRQGRCLLEPGPARQRANTILASLPSTLAITDDLDAAVLERMWELHNHFRTLLSTGTKDSNHWVFAAKLCARKRPHLFPVRDSQVCGYLSGWKALGAGPDRLGRFATDIQVFAYLMTHEAVSSLLTDLRSSANEAQLRIDRGPLRLLDAALWTQAIESSSRST
ncbi:DUF6308 family protein [Aldersonia kunmingensis]|uniref:DUF6308 family protein n=1 Tax=Aldersonia kunmingensis TaxID=408066 RepID=UPI00082BBBEE|nr:DUF6308 family protein [Aldersonia kunmingensis]